MFITSHLRQQVTNQFHHPRGVYGRVAGRIMARRQSNVARNQWIAEILDPPPGARILEIGHGPGLAIESLASRLDDGHIIGLEISSLMSRAASRRNRAHERDSRVEFRVGDSANPPSDLTGFDLIYGVNATMFWSDPEAAITTLISRLKPGGELVFTYMPPPTATESADDVAAGTRDLFAAAGLVDLSHDTMHGQPTAIATRGRRPRDDQR